MMEIYYESTHGVIRQLDPEPFDYEDSYMDSYRKISDEDHKAMSELRLNILINNLNWKPRSVLDIGYGKGEFLKHCASKGIKAYGYDVVKYQDMKEVTILEGIDEYEYDLITMFDTIEHCADLSFMYKIQPKFLYISVPWLPTRAFRSSEFENWFHRKPNEHIMHFDSLSLKKFIEHFGYELVYCGCPEDEIRIPRTDKPNILSQIFKRI